MYRAREKQMSIYDYLPPYHGELCNANRWVQLAAAIDWDGFEKAHKEITRTFIIADDFTVSNPERIRKAYARNSIDGFILKPNQVGTISEALESHRFANEHGLFSITSGRSGGALHRRGCAPAPASCTNLYLTAPRASRRRSSGSR